MNVDVFIDTNILVYAHDADAGNRHIRAKSLIENLWTGRKIPVISVQVLQELHVNLTRKGASLEESARIVERYLSWRVVDNTRHLLREALTEQQKWGLSFWDSLIVAAARRAGASTLWTEDLNEGQDLGGLLIANPLADRTA
jgi:predicted nucleic acid-binding protein